MVSEASKISIWNEWLEGDSINRIAEYAVDVESGQDISVRQVNKVLADPPPEVIANDLRYIHGVRSFWIYAEGRMNEVTGKRDAFVVVFCPLRHTSKAFQKAIRAISKDYKTYGASCRLNPYVIEGFEMDAALKFVHEHGYLAWSFDENGEIARYDGRFKQEEVATPRP